ncbi:MAG TPA: acyl-CoA dehydrogenase family protein, partial [Myxococcota bacterium]|nr:acyl-CoA dehydrogenase family protein [Myxococcota bacterium]
MSESDWRRFDLFAPTPQHALLADTLREFVSREVEPQAAEHDRSERFNLALFRRAGALGLLGVTIREEYGGSDLGATAAVQIFEAVSRSDPGFALAMLAHAVLFAQNVQVNGSDELKRRILPRATSGEWI